MGLDRAGSHAALEQLGTIWRSRVHGTARRTELAVLLCSTLCLAFAARVGTLPVRLAVALTLSALASTYVGWRVYVRKRWRSARGIIVGSIQRVDPDVAARALRALRLTERTAEDASAGSAELAQLHLERVIAKARPEAIEEKASSTATRLRHLGLLAWLAAVFAVCIAPYRILEGVDVLLARRGVAPLALTWLEQTTMVAHPPAYLRERDTTVDGVEDMALPAGTLLTIRGEPVRSGRHLLLVDSSHQVPFVDDAAGGVVARWTVTETTQLRVAARFGEVLVAEPKSIEIRSIPDERPQVVLEGAPRTTKLLDEPVIEIRYEVTDDHGLRDVDLVLRSAGHEDRRRLSRLEGDPRHDRGAYRIRATDPFFKRAYAPVEMTVEARDNDPITGPKWGQSATITVVPPLVGEPEALRFEAWVELRNTVTDALAFRVDSDPGAGRGQFLPTKGAGRQEHLDVERHNARQIESSLDRVLDRSFGGLRVPGGIQMLARGQMRKLSEALSREERSANSQSHGKNRKATEDAALAIDAAVRRLDVLDSTSIAKRLADVADDAAAGASQASDNAQRDRGLVRLDAATSVLDGGGAELGRLGMLGRDLGEIVSNDLKRIRRAQGMQDLHHAELAARDLAARLRHPLPSFGAGRRGGIESGGPPGEGEGGDQDASQKIAREQEQIEELARDHAAEVASVEQAMNNGAASDKLDSLRKEAKEHAQAIRDAVRRLPRSGGEPGAAESSASAAREHAEAMADELERADPASAVKSGRAALDALGQARRGPLGWDYLGGEDPRAEAHNAEGRLTPEVRWAERVLEDLRQAASARAGEDLRQASPREHKLADRARDLSRRGTSGEGALPGGTLDLLDGAERSMRDAAEALRDARGNQALDRQREAQRLLDMARSGDESSDEDAQENQQGRSNRRGDADGEGDLGHAAIPRAEDHKGPEAFRKRVLQGLGMSADPRLRDAVRRYAEGLLR